MLYEAEQILQAAAMDGTPSALAWCSNSNEQPEQRLLRRATGVAAFGVWWQSWRRPLEIETNAEDILRAEQALDAAWQEAQQAGFMDEELDE
jgi:hypothetical protein